MEVDPEAGSGEIGYWVAPAAGGRGLPHVDNAASPLVAERCGHVDTGERRKAPRGADPEPVYAVYAWEA